MWQEGKGKVGEGAGKGRKLREETLSSKKINTTNCYKMQLESSDCLVLIAITSSAPPTGNGVHQLRGLGMMNTGGHFTPDRAAK